MCPLCLKEQSSHLNVRLNPRLVLASPSARSLLLPKSLPFLPLSDVLFLAFGFWHLVCDALPCVFLCIYPAWDRILLDRFQFSVAVHLLENDLQKVLRKKAHSDCGARFTFFVFLKNCSSLSLARARALSDSHPACSVVFIMAQLRTLWNGFSAGLVP